MVSIKWYLGGVLKRIWWVLVYMYRQPESPLYWYLAQTILIIPYPRQLEASTSRSTLQFRNLHHRSIGVQNCGFYLLDPPKVLGYDSQSPHSIGAWNPRAGRPPLPGKLLIHILGRKYSGGNIYLDAQGA